MRVLLVIFVLPSLIFVSSDENDIRIADYLKQCGFLDSIKTTKCLLQSRKIKAESKNIVVSKNRNLTKLREVCKSTVSCIHGLRCKIAEKDHKDTLDFCWRATFEENFAECRDKLKVAEKIEEGECLKEKAKPNDKGEITQVGRCNWLRSSKNCMITNIGKYCGQNESSNWLRFSNELYISNDCATLTGLKF